MNHIEATASLLAQGYEPHEISLLQIVERAMIDHINFAVRFALQARNLDQRDKDGKYSEAWYVAQSIKTGLHEGLRGALDGVLCCPIHERCGKGRDHEGDCWDGQAAEWLSSS